VRTTVESAVGGTRLPIRGSGVYDFAGRLGRLRLVFPNDASGTPEHSPITELLAPSVLFMLGRGAGIPPDKWLRADTDTIADGNLVSGGATDPLLAAELLRGTRTVTASRVERLHGATVRHFRGTTNVGLAARAVYAAPSGAQGALAAAAGGLADPTAPFDAYLDRWGRLRMVRYRFLVRDEGQPGREGAAGAPRTVSVLSTTELYDFGAHAAVDLPESADIYPGAIGSVDD
jgi:hypothetical protein